jgi:thiosulfate reductase cytochrome b subunit
MEQAIDPLAAGETVAVAEARVQGTRAVIEKHHALVRWTHWLNVPILAGLILSGLSIYSASPVYQHAPDPVTRRTDYVEDAGVWICAHVPGLHAYRDPPNWFYNHFARGGYAGFAPSLRLHWLFAYLFMANGLVYLVGLVLGGGYRALLPRLGDLRDASLMLYHYAGVPFAKLAGRAWPRPRSGDKYNALQRLSYFAMPVAGTLAILSGWAVHKPMQMQWLATMFGGYDAARVWHFWLMWVFVLFVVPHVVLVFADGWDTVRSMLVGWSERTGGGSDD